MNEPSFGDLLNQWRAAKNLTLKDVAEAVGVSVVHIHDIENNRRTPSADTVMRICALFEMQPLDHAALVLQQKFQKQAGHRFIVEVRTA